MSSNVGVKSACDQRDFHVKPFSITEHSHVYKGNKKIYVITSNDGTNNRITCCFGSGMSKLLNDEKALEIVGLQSKLTKDVESLSGFVFNRELNSNLDVEKYCEAAEHAFDSLDSILNFQLENRIFIILANNFVFVKPGISNSRAYPLNADVCNVQQANSLICEQYEKDENADIDGAMNQIIKNIREVVPQYLRLIGFDKRDKQLSDYPQVPYADWLISPSPASCTSADKSKETTVDESKNNSRRKD